MEKYTQTLARLGAGLSSIGALIWLLWPDDMLGFWDPEPLFAFCVALVVWVFTEFKFSEEATVTSASPNDIRNARDFLRMHSEEFRILLKEHDTFQFLHEEFYNLAGRLLNRVETGQLVFQNSELNERLQSFSKNLDVFYHFVCANTVPEKIAGSWRVGFKPYGLVSEEEYDARLGKSEEANQLALEAWDDLENLCRALHKLAPEALNEPLSEVSWFNYDKQDQSL